MYLSVFSFPFLMMHPPWTIWHRLSMLLRRLRSRSTPCRR